MIMINDFEIEIFKNGTRKVATVSHNGETFDLDYFGTAVSLINNGDNSWSIVEGDISQEHANEIGQAIEKRLENYI